MSNTNRIAIIDAINTILRASGRNAVEPQTDCPLSNLGLDSLDLAVLVVALEKELGTDPFRNGTARAATFGEFVALYESAAKPS